jgi:hypothetical protein
MEPVRRGSRDSVSHRDVGLTGLSDELLESMVVNSLGSIGRDHVTIVPDHDRKDESPNLNSVHCQKLGQNHSECRDRQHGSRADPSGAQRRNVRTLHSEASLLLKYQTVVHSAEESCE